MKRYLAKRLVFSVLTVYLVATAVFAVIRAIPGDPVNVIAPNAGPSQVEALRTQMNLGEPLHLQYIDWIVSISTLDFGESVFSGQSVGAELISNAEPTLSIAFLGMTIALLVGIPGGIVSSVRRYHMEDNVITVFAFLGISLPAFWIGILLILTFNRIGFPVFGYVSLSEGVIPWLKHIMLPAVAVGIPYGGIIQRFMRSSMIEVMNEDFIRLAKAKGLDWRLVIFKHAFQNALLPIITMSGIILGVMISGIIAVEVVFGIQGFGRMLLGSIQARDYPVIQGTVIVVSVVFVVMNLLVDLLYVQVNPKIKY